MAEMDGDPSSKVLNFRTKGGGGGGGGEATQPER